MLAQATAGDPFLQYGALGLVAIVVIYLTGKLVGWLTNTLNGKLDRLANATDTNTTAVRESVGAQLATTREIENLRQEIAALRRDQNRRG